MIQSSYKRGLDLLNLERLQGQHFICFSLLFSLHSMFKFFKILFANGPLISLWQWNGFRRDSPRIDPEGMRTPFAFQITARYSQPAF